MRTAVLTNQHSNMINVAYSNMLGSVRPCDYSWTFVLSFELAPAYLNDEDLNLSPP